MNENRKSRIAFWAAIAFAALAGYALSIGPACWTIERGVISPRHVNTLYNPLLFLEFHAPQGVQDALSWYAHVLQADSGLAALRDEPFLRKYFAGDLAYRLAADRPVFDVWDNLAHLISTTIEPSSWDDLGGNGSLKVDAVSQTIEVVQSRRVHAGTSAYFASLREIKRARRHIRDMDLWAACRVYYCREWCYSTFLQDELLSRALVIGDPRGERLTIKGESFSDVEDLIAFLSRQTRDSLRRGIFWQQNINLKQTSSMAASLKTFCQRRNIDLFIEIPRNCFGQCSPDIHWEVRATDSEYL